MKQPIYLIMLILLSAAVFAASECTDGMTANIVAGSPSFECHMTYCTSLVVNVSIDPHQDAASNEYTLIGCTNLDPLADDYTGSIRYSCPCTDNYIFNLTALPNSNGTYHINFAYNYSVWVADPPSDDGNGGGGGGGSGGGGSSSDILNYGISNESKHDRILMKQTCLQIDQAYEFYIQGDGKAYLELTSFDKGIAKYIYQAYNMTGSFELILNQTKYLDIYRRNGIDDMEIMYVYDSQIFNIPCLNVTMIREIVPEESKTNISDLMVGPVVTLPEELVVVKQKPYWWIWLIVLAAVILAAVIYYLTRRDKHGESVLREVQEADGSKRPKDRKKR